MPVLLLIVYNHCSDQYVSNIYGRTTVAWTILIVDVLRNPLRDRDVTIKVLILKTK